MKRKTAGELANQCARDPTIYDSLEVGYHLTEDLAKELQKCVETHDKIFDMDEYCVVMVLATDPLIRNCIRRKIYGYPYLPSPRPSQTVFLYNKKKQQFMKRLWVLPNALAMETLYETVAVAKPFENMKRWSHAFYDGVFWETIRKEHNITMLSESEYLQAHREKFLKAGAKQVPVDFADPFDFSKITVNQIVDTDKTGT